MSLLKKILLWCETLPAWQQDACRRLLQNEDGLDSDDYKELYILLKKENGIKVDSAVSAAPLANEHLPVELETGDTVTLIALRELVNVNQIPKNHTLTFSETGMTVIYGGNGTGKSGYARVMKRACRARDQSEKIHPNVNDPAAKNKIPNAKFDIKIAGAPEEIIWSNDTTPSAHLSTISVFNSKCARSYITAEQDVAYLPYGLDIVESLANKVLPGLSELLDAEIGNIDVDTLPFEHLFGETEVGKAIEGLSVISNTDTITSLGTLTEEDNKRIIELDAVLNEADPLSKAKEFKLSAMRLKTYVEKLDAPLIWLSNKAVSKLKKLVEVRKAAEAAEKIAADALCAGEELLPGTGDQQWKVLFEAARRYSQQSAYPGEDFPQDTEDKLCPLCQEELGDNGVKRFNRFDVYVKNDVAKTADAARNRVNIAKNKIENTELKVIADAALADELNVLDNSLLQRVNDFQASIDTRKNLILVCLENTAWDEVPALIESPRACVRWLAAQQLKAYRRLERAADEEKRKRMGKEHAELSAKRDLAKSLKAVLELIGRMKRKASLEKCRTSLKTRSISDKSKEFATVAVTNELKRALDKEFALLGIGHIKMKLKERSARGKMYHQLLLDIPTAIKIDEILSEGEQRAIALGSFFAELSLSNHSCGIIFDDPVSSLDHWRRRNVASRLVEEAKKRQVIVFTHDTSFLGQLSDEINEAQISNTMSFMEWKNGAPGYVSEGLPWDHQGYKARINALEQAQSKLAKNWPVYPSESDVNEIKHQYDRLRATLERVIQDVVFNGVVKRYRDWIKVELLEGVVGFDSAEYEVIRKLHKRSCNIVTAHDSSSAKAASVPTAEALGNDIIELKLVIENIKKRRKKANKASI